MPRDFHSKRNKKLTLGLNAGRHPLPAAFWGLPNLMGGNPAHGDVLTRQDFSQCDTRGDDSALLALASTGAGRVFVRICGATSRI